jgi:hypothetical protein
VAITLGKDCTLSVGPAGGGQAAVVGVRNVTAEQSVTEQEFVPYGSRVSVVYPTAYATTVSLETIDDQAATANTFVTWLEQGTKIDVVGTGFSFTGVVTSVSDSQPLDGVRTFSVTIRQTFLSALGAVS